MYNIHFAFNLVLSQACHIVIVFPFIGVHLHPSLPPFGEFRSTPSLILDLEDSLSKVLPLKHADKPLGSIVNALGLGELNLDGAVGQPLLHLLLVVLGVLWTKILVANNETPHGDALGHDMEKVFDSIFILGFLVVVGDLCIILLAIARLSLSEIGSYHSAGYNPSKVVHLVQRCLQLFATIISSVSQSVSPL